MLKSIVKIISIAAFAAIFFHELPGQKPYRIAADILVREKLADSTFRVIKGRIFYDKNLAKLVYQITFPQKENWVLHDTSFYRFGGDTLIERTTIPNVSGLMLFDMCMTGDLKNLKLDENGFEIDELTEEKGYLHVSWIPSEKSLKKIAGKIILTYDANRLFGISFYDRKGKLHSQQFIRSYHEASGVAFPEEIVELVYSETDTIYKITAFDHFIVNEDSNETVYDYPVLGNME